MDFAIPPAVSNVADTCHTRSMLTAPGVNFKAYNARLAGEFNDPEVSVPTDNGLKPAATPMVDPVEDPPGHCRRGPYRLASSFLARYEATGYIW